MLGGSQTFDSYYTIAGQYCWQIALPLTLTLSLTHSPPPPPPPSPLSLLHSRSLWWYEREREKERWTEFPVPTLVAKWWPRAFGKEEYVPASLSLCFFLSSFLLKACLCQNLGGAHPNLTLASPNTHTPLLSLPWEKGVTMASTQWMLAQTVKRFYCLSRA